jgi:hypothetical protein
MRTHPREPVSNFQNSHSGRNANARNLDGARRRVPLAVPTNRRNMPAAVEEHLLRCQQTGATFGPRHCPGDRAFGWAVLGRACLRQEDGMVLMVKQGAAAISGSHLCPLSHSRRPGDLESIRALSTSPVFCFFFSLPLIPPIKCQMSVRLLRGTN